MPIELRFIDGLSVDYEMETMTMAMIVSTVPKFKFSRQEKRCRQQMLERVAILPTELQRKLRMVVKEKQMEAVGQLTTVLDDGDSVMGISDDVGLDVGQVDCDEDVTDEKENFLKPVSQSICFIGGVWHHSD